MTEEQRHKEKMHALEAIKWLLVCIQVQIMAIMIVIAVKVV